MPAVGKALNVLTSQQFSRFADARIAHCADAKRDGDGSKHDMSDRAVTVD